MTPPTLEAIAAVDEQVVCGTSLGRANPDAVENRLVTDRVPVDGFATFHG